MIASTQRCEALSEHDYASRGRNELALRARRAGRHVRLSLYRRGGPSRARRRAGRSRSARATSYCSEIRRSSRKSVRDATACTAAIRCCSICSATRRRSHQIAASSSILPIACSPRSARLSPTRCTKAGCTPPTPAREHRVTIGTRVFAGLYFSAGRPLRQQLQLDRGSKRDRRAQVARGSIRSRARHHRRHAVQRSTPPDLAQARRCGIRRFASAPSTSFRGKRRPSSSIRWRRRAVTTCRATWSFSSSAIASTSRSLGREPPACWSAARACSTSPAARPKRWRWRTCSARSRTREDARAISTKATVVPAGRGRPRSAA